MIQIFIPGSVFSNPQSSLLLLANINLSWLLEPLEFAFMRQAIAIGIALGILSAVVGSYLILQQMGMMSDVISHAVLPGMALAFFLELNLALGAFITGLSSAFVVMGIQKRSRVRVDAAMALTLSSFLALGIILINTLEANQINLEEILFGDILGVTSNDVWHTLAIASVILLLTKLFYKELEFYTFDPLGAKACGLPVNLLYFGLVCAITLTIVASMRTVGVLLVMSLLVGPAITAYLLVRELASMMILGSLLGAGSAVTGMYISYYFDLPSGAAIVMVIFIFFWLAFFFSPSQGLLTEPEFRKKVGRWLKSIFREIRP